MGRGPRWLTEPSEGKSLLTHSTLVVGPSLGGGQG